MSGSPIDEEQTRALEDLSHQLGTPLAAASIRLDHLIARGGDPYVQSELRRVAGLLRKVDSVRQTLSLFASIEPWWFEARPIASSDLARVISEVVSDVDLTAADETDVHFVRERFEQALKPTEGVYGDIDSVRQILFVLLDNAQKYSFRGETILVDTSRHHDYVSIAVQSIGIPLRPDELDLAKSRGWRSEIAAAISGQGSGIGLWMADRLAKALRGTLVVHATDADNTTVVELRLPLSPPTHAGDAPQHV